MVRASHREGQGAAARHDGGGQAGSSHCPKVAGHWPPRHHNAKGQARNGFAVSEVLGKGLMVIGYTIAVVVYSRVSSKFSWSKFVDALSQTKNRKLALNLFANAILQIKEHFCNCEIYSLRKHLQKCPSLLKITL